MLLVGAAWQACDDATPGGGFFLLLLFLPALFLAAWLGFVMAGILTFWAPPPVRLLAGVSIAFMIGVLAVAAEVPAYPAEDYAAPAAGVSSMCGPDGMPAWWPPLLPR